MRGAKLREHILWSAKNVFLDSGFERASMDVIAASAGTSKRTLYAHFDNKDALFLAVIDLVCDMFLSKLKAPGEYSDDATEAVIFFCARYGEGMMLSWTVRMCRMMIAEADHFPTGARRYFEVVFTMPHERLSSYLQEALGLSEVTSSTAAHDLLSRVIYPQWQRALFGIDPLAERFDEENIRADFELQPIRQAVEKWIASMA